MPEQRPILIAAGGTGGHVFPALAVAQVLRERGVPVVWLGTRAGTEAQAVPAAGFDIEWVTVVGLRGKTLLETLLAPVKLLRSCVEAWKIFKRRRPVAVLGMGGFVTAPGALLAIVRRLPLFLHEQNSVAGLTNRFFSRFARKVFTAFPGVLNGVSQHERIGNPVRSDIENLVLEASQRSTSADQGRELRLLVVGGSLGARVLNQTIPEAMQHLGDGYEVWHQCGGNELEPTREAYKFMGSKARVEPFIDDMAAAYDWADLVICRAGAMTVAELSAAGVPSILVPYPYAVDDHQTGNARWLADQGAAVLQPQGQLQANTLAETIRELGNDAGHRQEMALAARSLHQSGAAERLANELLEVAA